MAAGYTNDRYIERIQAAQEKERRRKKFEKKQRLQQLQAQGHDEKFIEEVINTPPLQRWQR